MTKRKQRKLNWEEVPPQGGDVFDFDLAIGKDGENEASNLALLQCHILGRAEALMPDMSVFSPTRPPDPPTIEMARAVFLDEDAELAHRQAAADLVHQSSRPRLEPGQRLNDDVLRLELVLSVYATHGEGSHADVLRTAEEAKLPRSWFVKWRLVLPDELLSASQVSGRVATYSDRGLQYSECVPREMWADRFSAIKGRNTREAPERWHL